VNVDSLSQSSYPSSQLKDRGWTLTGLHHGASRREEAGGRNCAAGLGTGEEGGREPVACAVIDGGTGEEGARARVTSVPRSRWHLVKRSRREQVSQGGMVSGL
jgi:hypothetical protein